MLASWERRSGAFWDSAHGEGGWSVAWSQGPREGPERCPGPGPRREGAPGQKPGRGPHALRSPLSCEHPRPPLRHPRAKAPGHITALCLLVPVHLCHPLPPAPVAVLSIHKLPASGATDISFPMKGWRATGDWAKVPEDRVTVSKSVFSTGLAGEGPSLETWAPASGGLPPGRSFWSLVCCLKAQGAVHVFLGAPKVAPSSRKPSLPSRCWPAPRR